MENTMIGWKFEQPIKSLACDQNNLEDDKSIKLNVTFIQST